MSSHLRFFDIIFMLFIFFDFVRLEIVSKEILLKNDSYNENITNNSYFKIKYESESDIPENIKIVAEGENSKVDINSNYINHVISYYQDPEFELRKQLSQNISGITVMYLNKEQIKNEFYISIECAKKPCKYLFSIFPEIIPEIPIGEQYTYYITKENQKMSFLFDFNSIKNEMNVNINNNSIVTIWARGNKKINSTLDNITYEKHLKYNAYLIKNKDIINNKYEFRIEGNVGDLINIGSLLFEENTSICNSIIIDNGIKYTGFLKRDILEENCFKIPIDKQNKRSNFFVYNNPYDITEYQRKDDEYYIKCIKISNNIEEIFYSVHFTFDEEDDNLGMNKDTPLELGLQNLKYFKEGKTIGLISMNTEENFKYLTYHVFNEQGKMNMSIYTCDSYPLCSIDINYLNNTIPIQEYRDTFSYSLSKDDLKDIYSPISKRQNILLFNCIKGSDFDEKEKNRYKSCSAKILAFTEKNNLSLSSEMPSYVYIREGGENNYLYEPEVKKFPEDIYINIKKYSGDISVNINPFKQKYKYKNSYLFISDNRNAIKLSITAKKNSIYSIIYHSKIPDDNQHIISVGENYIFNFEDNLSLNLKYINYKDVYFYNMEYLPNYFSLCPINCNITVESSFMIVFPPSMENTPLKEYKGFYQDIIKNKDQNNYTHLGYIINNTDKEKKNCSFSASFFKLENETNNNDNGISLENNTTYLFLFDQNYSSVKYIYPFSQDSKNISIEFNILNETKFRLELFINNKKIKEEFELDSNQTIIIEPIEWQEICKESKQLCKLSFRVKSENIEKSQIEIFFNRIYEEESEEGEEENDKKKKELIQESNNHIVLIIIIVVLSIIIIGVIIFFVLRNRKKNDNICEEIEQFRNTKCEDNTVKLME